MTIDIDALKQDKRPQSSTIVHALIDRLEAAESEALEEARLNGMGSEREAALMAKLEAAEKERDALRAKVAEMERQEPVAWYSKQYGFVYMSRHSSQFEHGSILYLRNGTPAWRIEGSSKVALLDMASLPHGTVFYALPGAQPAPSVPGGWKLVPIEPTSEMLDKGSDQSFGYVSIALDVWAAMLAAAPEAKP